MTRRAGFTIVELAIVMVIMAVLIVLAAAGLRTTQQNGRDEERKTDVANIALALERYRSSSDDDIASTGRYPDTATVAAEITSSATRYSFLPGIDATSLRAPDVSTTENISLVVSTSNFQDLNLITPKPTFNTYVYQPLYYSSIYKNYRLCTNQATQDCRKFNIYYLLEGETEIQKLTSKHQ